MVSFSAEMSEIEEESNPLHDLTDSRAVYGDAQGESSAVDGQDHARKAKASHRSIPTLEIDGNVPRLLCRSRSSSESISVIILAWTLTRLGRR